MQIKEAKVKWNISERRIRKLIKDGRIKGAKKVGNVWLIPDDIAKPIDKRFKVKDTYIINLDLLDFTDINNKLKILNSKRPLKDNELKSLKDEINLEWTYNSNGIEGNTLTLKETKIVLEGITVGGKTMKEHLEAINHSEAISYIYELVKNNTLVTEHIIKELHYLILKGIDKENAGVYRKENVLISGASHIPPNHFIVPNLMEEFLINYNLWKNKYNDIICASLLHIELVKIHPFVDGNGRLSRLLLNLELMKSGFLPIIIKKENRLDYYNALDKAHTKGDSTDFIKLIIKYENDMLDRYLNFLS